MFLSTFFSRMIIRHRLETTHLNVNDLSRLKFDTQKQNNVLDLTNVDEEIESNTIRIVMSIMIIKDIDNFLKRVVKKLAINDVFRKIYTHFQKQIQRIAINDEKLNFFINSTDLISTSSYYI